MNAHTIDFSKFGGPVFSGRARGIAARAEHRLDDLDQSSESLVDVKIPQDAYTVTSSFFLGLFGPSVIRAGNRERFKEKFHFDDVPEFLNDDIDQYISIALQGRDLFK